MVQLIIAVGDITSSAPPQSYPGVDGAAVGFCVNESYDFRAALQLQSVWIDSPQNKAA